MPKSTYPEHSVAASRIMSPERTKHLPRRMCSRLCQRNLQFSLLGSFIQPGIGGMPLLLLMVLPGMVLARL